MSPNYLLPCSCGNKIPVDLAQAGSRVRCTCGAEMEVPTLLGLKRLARSDSEPAERPKAQGGPAWGTRQRLVFFGVVLTVVGIASALWFFYTRPRMVDVALYPPWAALQLWESLRMGVDLPASPTEKAVYDVIRQHHRWTIAGLVLAAIGVLVASGAMLVKDRASSKPPAA